MFWEERKARIHVRERETVALLYLGALAPVFGILLAAMIAHAYRERSRTIVFHARQAIAGQALALFAFVVINLFRLLGVIMGVLDPRVREILLTFTWALLVVLGIAYVLWHVLYAWKALEGRDLNYPVIGARLRGESE